MTRRGLHHNERRVGFCSQLFYNLSFSHSYCIVSANRLSYDAVSVHSDRIVHVVINSIYRFL